MSIIDSTDLDELLDKAAERDRMRAALEEVEEYLDDRADADDGRPNDAMRLLVEVRAALGAK